MMSRLRFQTISFHSYSKSLKRGGKQGRIRVFQVVAATLVNVTITLVTVTVNRRKTVTIVTIIVTVTNGFPESYGTVIYG